jgi:hypothetical protein
VDFLRATTILEIDGKNAPLQSVDVVEFFYYAGIWYVRYMQNIGAPPFAAALTVPVLYPNLQTLPLQLRRGC